MQFVKESHDNQEAEKKKQRGKRNKGTQNYYHTTDYWGKKNHVPGRWVYKNGNHPWEGRLQVPLLFALHGT